MTTDTTDLPPLPEPEGAMSVDAGPFMRDGQEIGRIEECADAYSEAQMRAYARLAVEQAGWRGCAGCSTPNDCRMHGCGVTRGLWKNPAAIGKT